MQEHPKTGGVCAQMQPKRSKNNLQIFMQIFEYLTGHMMFKVRYNIRWHESARPGKWRTPGCFSFSFLFSLSLLSLFHFHYTTRQLNMWLATSALLPAVFHFDFHFHFLTFTFHFHYTARQLNMWLAMSDVLLAVFHFSAPLPYGRTRAPIKKLPQWSICILLWQKGTITCLPVELSLLAYRRLEFQNIVCSILSFFFRGHECLVYDLGEDLWLCMMIIQVWISQWPDCLDHEKPKSQRSPLIQRGWRIRYCALADVFTQCPEELSEFLKQRRRWTVSGKNEMKEHFLLGRGGIMASFCNNRVTF